MHFFKLKKNANIGHKVTALKQCCNRATTALQQHHNTATTASLHRWHVSKALHNKAARYRVANMQSMP